MNKLITSKIYRKNADINAQIQYINDITDKLVLMQPSGRVIRKKIHPNNFSDDQALNRKKLKIELKNANRGLMYLMGNLKHRNPIKKVSIMAVEY